MQGTYISAGGKLNCNLFKHAKIGGKVKEKEQHK